MAANAIVEIASDRRGARRVRARDRQEQPARAVEQRADPAREREHEKAEPHDVRVDADRITEAGGNARDDTTIVAADQAATFRHAPPDDRTVGPAGGSVHTPSPLTVGSGAAQGWPRWCPRPGGRTITP